MKQFIIINNNFIFKFIFSFIFRFINDFKSSTQRQNFVDILPTVRPSPGADRSSVSRSRPRLPNTKNFFFLFKKWSNSSSSTIISTLNSSIILSKWSSSHKIMIYDNDFINNLKNCDDKFSITDHFGDKDDAKITNYHFQKSSIIFKIRGRK